MTETVEDLVMCVNKVLENEETSIEAVKSILAHFGGMQVYLPLPDRAFKEKDEEAIYDAFTGDNGPELCRKYKISFNTLYIIIRRERDRRAGKVEKKAVREFSFE